MKTSKKDGGSESTIIKTRHVNSENYLGDAEVRAGEFVDLGGADFLKSEDSTENKLRISAKDVKNTGNYSAALYLRLLNSHLIGFLALAKERVRLL
ncbi:MAG: hypothetical protein KZQ62_02190, partial [Candidatus Thiodiazotropha sp. (ex Lucinoma aequizonata)]|nr:hypothetical protein [Candidatus Thiodiazotropha sp. (ex Lucinoma aequizonata)]MCU7900496.1 hypothetical protein [Candidatus Thiodiazotropha sp. (ex Lucinoma aequizonata)]